MKPLRPLVCKRCQQPATMRYPLVRKKYTDVQSWVHSSETDCIGCLLDLIKEMKKTCDS